MNKVTLGLLVAVIVVVGAIIMQNRAAKSSSDTSSSSLGEQQTTPPAPTTDPNAKVKIEDLVVGTGQEAKVGNTVDVKYTGTLTDGTKFDSTDDHGGKPFTFTIGHGQVIKGWDEGIPGMKVGGKRRLTIPPQLGYGDQAAGSIPPNSTLIFEVELVDIK